ncbi:MAG: DUF2834 domain-containing protein [Sandaracinaceae bacterium]
MKHLFLALAVLGTVAPYAAFAPWLAEHGLDIGRLVREMFANPVARFFSLDVIVSALVVVAMVARGTRRGVRHAWLAVVGTLGVGVSLGLPLYLYLEARHDEADA